jgi:16S rRNA (guanine527-N7)-methyltransferase
VEPTSDAKAKVAQLGERYGLDTEQVDRLAEVLAALARDELAPTTVRAPAEAADVHLADSLVALELKAVRVARRMVEIGAGAGFPGVPLAVALPGCGVALVESQARKCEFIERTLAAAGIDNARAVCARVEEWPEGIGVHDVALARALAPQPVVLEYAAPLLRLGGTVVDWRGRRDPEHESAGLEAAEELGLERVRVLRAQPFAGARDHHLHVFVKRGKTPDRFPRRVGMARKKPLAGVATSASRGR